MTREDTSDEAWHRRAAQCTEAVRRWVDLMADGGEIQVGSALDGDDRFGSHYRPSQLAWFGIQTAVDHLNAMADLLELDDAPGPFAPLTLARGAILGACQAAWILAPAGRPVRQQRAALIGADEYRKEAAHIEEQGRVEWMGSRLPAEAREAITTRVQVLRERAKDAQDRSGRSLRFESTEMIHDVIKELGEADPAMRSALVSQWRVTSAVAHGRAWQLRVRPAEVERDAEGASYRYRLEGTVAEVAQSFSVATLLTGEALDLWYQRAARHH